MHIPTLLISALALPLFVVAQSSSSSPTSATTSSVSSSSASATASISIDPGTGLFSYQGCYNETTGNPSAGDVRALSGGSINMEGQDDMTVEQCLSYCGSDTYAGLEYGRECWCGEYLNVLSNKLDDTECNIPCAGEAGDACGGQLKLSLYKRTQSATGKKNSAASHGASLSGVLGVVGLLLIGTWA